MYRMIDKQHIYMRHNTSTILLLYDSFIKPPILCNEKKNVTLHFEHNSRHHLNTTVILFNQDLSLISIYRDYLSSII